VCGSGGSSRGARFLVLAGLIAVAHHTSRAALNRVGAALLESLVLAFLGSSNVQVVDIFVMVVLRLFLKGGAIVRKDLIRVLRKRDHEWLSFSHALPNADHSQKDNGQRKYAYSNDENTSSRIIGG